MSEPDVRTARSIATETVQAAASLVSGDPDELTDREVNRIAPTRGDRLFLVLSIFIGCLSGLLVVCFRISIEWLQVLLLGSGPHPGQDR